MTLHEFYNDKEIREAVYNYLTQFLTEQAVKKVFNKEDTSAIGEAKELVDKAFDNLDILFRPKRKRKEPVNPAR